MFHRTTPKAAAHIKKERSMMGKENGIFFTTNPIGEYTQEYGSAVVSVRVPLEQLELNDILGMKRIYVFQQKDRVNALM